ncbi:hypothetical protein H5410_030459 [Solanum commersonii]|uniref:Uncharacterized protein n=1 Tax=Solanum commersonii TaxID=4109 RepID=A0A9J5YFR0_SOLCO|nr:hypothetical protein H5410_030459 [Solanum commersonii]
MPKTRSMASLKISDLLSSNSPVVLSFSSDESLASPSLSSKRKATTTKKKGAKSTVDEPGAKLSDFDPLSLYFEHRILAHIIATTLLPRKGSLSNISNKDVFVLYCLLKKYRINSTIWFKEYMWESSEESNPSSSLPYESSTLLLQESDELKTRILVVECGWKLITMPLIRIPTPVCPRMWNAPTTPSVKRLSIP